jgi:hypothetical protein
MNMLSRVGLLRKAKREESSFLKKRTKRLLLLRRLIDPGLGR